MNRKLFVAVQFGLLTLLAGTIAAAATAEAPADEGAGQTRQSQPRPQGQPQTATGPAAPLDTVSSAFTYQARFMDGGSLANGQYDLEFKVFDAATGGVQVSTTITRTNVTVTDGLFTTLLSFAPQVFEGEKRWLQIGIRPAGGGSFTALTRQEITASPYATTLRPGAVMRAATSDTMLTMHNKGSGDGLQIQTNIGSALFAASTLGAAATFYGNSAPAAVQAYTFSSNPDASALYARNHSGFGIVGESNNRSGVRGIGSGGEPGVLGTGTSMGVKGEGADYGVVGTGLGCCGAGGYFSGTAGTAVEGHSETGYGAAGYSQSGFGGFFSSFDSDGVNATTTNGTAVFGQSVNGNGGEFSSGFGDGVRGDSQAGVGVRGSSINDNGGRFTSANSDGLVAETFSADSAAVVGISNQGTGVYGASGTGPAGWFQGRVQVKGNITVTGNLTVTGTIFKGAGGFMIDHPLDPENKYLYHSFVESPDMKNVYDGNVITDARGEASVALPDYFEAVNRDYRYQLTVIGQFAQAIVSSEIKNNRFTIRTDKPNVKVSWQVTGIRKDPYAEHNRIHAEVDKSASESGTYLHPTEWGQPESKGIGYQESQQMLSREQSIQSEAREQRQRVGGR
jgi:hypothetical protein